MLIKVDLLLLLDLDLTDLRRKRTISRQVSKTLRKAHLALDLLLCRLDWDFGRRQRGTGASLFCLLLVASPAVFL